MNCLRLVHKRSYFDTNRLANLLKLAHKHGWKPMGTEYQDWGYIPETKNYEKEFKKAKKAWPGAYCSCDGQLVKKEDALAIASALELALSAMEEDLKGSYYLTGEYFEEAPYHYIRKGSHKVEMKIPPYDPFELLRRWQKHVRRFAAFCRKGGFFIF